MPDASDNCPANANADQADDDKDGVGDACDLLPPGDVPPAPGQTAVVRAISGEVFVKLPGRSLKQNGGFIPLKGVASVPVGSTVDARKGELELKSAANGFAASDRRAKQQTARIRAGHVRHPAEAKAKKGVAKSASISTDIGLLTPPGAEAACRQGPGEGHRPLALDGRQGPLPHARRREHRHRPQRDLRHHRPLRRHGHRGRQGPRHAGVQGLEGKPVTVKAGGAYLAKAKLFRARKGRP